MSTIQYLSQVSPLLDDVKPAAELFGAVLPI